MTPRPHRRPARRERSRAPRRPHRSGSAWVIARHSDHPDARLIEPRLMETIVRVVANCARPSHRALLMAPPSRDRPDEGRLPALIEAVKTAGQLGRTIEVLRTTPDVARRVDESVPLFPAQLVPGLLGESISRLPIDSRRLGYCCGPTVVDPHRRDVALAPREALSVPSGSLSTIGHCTRVESPYGLAKPSLGPETDVRQTPVRESSGVKIPGSFNSVLAYVDSCADDWARGAPLAVFAGTVGILDSVTYSDDSGDMVSPHGAWMRTALPASLIQFDLQVPPPAPPGRRAQQQLQPAAPGNGEHALRTLQSGYMARMRLRFRRSHFGVTLSIPVQQLGSGQRNRVVLAVKAEHGRPQHGRAETSRRDVPLPLNGVPGDHPCPALRNRGADDRLSGYRRHG